MIFPAMMFALGFVCAALLAWLIVPPIVRSAGRNRERRSKLPQDIKSALADKDRLRAEFALSLRKAERKIEKLESRAHDQLIKLAARNAKIGSLKKELSRLLDPGDHQAQDKLLSEKEDNVEQAKTSETSESAPQVKEGDVHTLEPKDIDLSKLVPASPPERIEPVLKGSLANRIHKLKSSE